MKKCKVLIPFTDKESGKALKAGDSITLTDERISEIRAVNTNMVDVIGDAKPRKTKE